MSKREITLRHTAIINKLKRGAATFDEITKYLETETDISGYMLTISERTFRRDRHDILSLYNISIECEKSSNKYYISETDDSALNNRMLDAFNTLNALNSSIGLTEFLEFEDFATSGNEHFHGILHAIKNKLELALTYRSYWNDKESERTVQPYLLKEHKKRWYMIAFDPQKGEFRTFGLDRIKSIEIKKSKFSHNQVKEARNYFKYSFGVIAPNHPEPAEQVVLSFEPFQGNYIKSLPLHPSQQILIDDEKELRISLDVYSTFDLEMQIMSHGNRVKVISPDSLKISIIETMKQTLQQYKNNA